MDVEVNKVLHSLLQLDTWNVTFLRTTTLLAKTIYKRGTSEVTIRHTNVHGRVPTSGFLYFNYKSCQCGLILEKLLNSYQKNFKASDSVARNEQEQNLIVNNL